MATAVADAPPDESWVGELQDRIAGVCGQINALHGELVSLVGARDDRRVGAWGVECRPNVGAHAHAPGDVDREVMEFAKAATVARLRAGLSTYQWIQPAKENEPRPAREDAFGYFDEHGHYHLAVHAGNDVGVVIDAALREAGGALFDAGHPDVTWLELCPKHHSAHHRGGYTIAGDANIVGGLRFCDARGRPIPPVATPAVPTGPPELKVRYEHPSGERFDRHDLYFNHN